jgi:hypothetical protein
MVNEAVGEFLNEETRKGLIFGAHEVNNEPGNRPGAQRRWHARIKR